MHLRLDTMVAGELAIALDLALLAEHTSKDALWFEWAMYETRGRRLAWIHSVCWVAESLRQPVQGEMRTSK